MISPESFYNALGSHGINFYTGVPDSLLKNLCAYITDHAPSGHHIIAANEGGAVGLAAGHYLASSSIPVVYMQNSGLGNTVNPLLSLTDEAVYNIPVPLIIGWRGEPGVHDEPQHVKQGAVTLQLLDAMGIGYEILTQDEQDLEAQIARAADYLTTTCKAFALVVHKGTFSDYRLQTDVPTPFAMEREDAIGKVSAALPEDAVVVSTTGKISRELFEWRERRNEGHERDFLTVGSMGHASQIALGIALEQPGRMVFVFDGDGAVIMHMGALGIIGSQHPENLCHIVFNNGAHDSVGGQPTIGFQIDIPQIALSCGYLSAFSVSTEEQLKTALDVLPRLPKPCLIEIRVRKGSRADLGRPTTTPRQNKEALMNFLQESQNETH
jgi:phosphonopyruvate decarboxylase